MHLSFVIYYHSSRLDNLKQMIRLLTQREDVSETQIVLACQDACSWRPDGFRDVQTLSLGLPRYHKPFLCNRGVEAATGHTIALLDSDRVLPAGWFARHASNLPNRTVLTTRNLSWCAKPYTDEEIERGEIELIPDPKCPQNTMMRKNAFSGNTIMRRADYLSVGGMDESFVGYGFADNDMVERCKAGGLDFKFVDDPELHLFHEKYVMIDGRRVPRSEFRAYTLLNGLKFCLKWKKPPTAALLELVHTVRSECGDSPLMPEITNLIKRFRIFQ